MAIQAAARRRAQQRALPTLRAQAAERAAARARRQRAAALIQRQARARAAHAMHKRSAAATIQKHARGRAARRELSRQVGAATLIEAAARGRAARALAATKRDALREEAEQAARAAAATVISRVAKPRAVRSRAARLIGARWRRHHYAPKERDALRKQLEASGGALSAASEYAALQEQAAALSAARANAKAMEARMRAGELRRAAEERARAAAESAVRLHGEEAWAAAWAELPSTEHIIQRDLAAARMQAGMRAARTRRMLREAGAKRQAAQAAAEARAHVAAASARWLHSGEPWAAAWIDVPAGEEVMRRDLAAARVQAGLRAQRARRRAAEERRAAEQRRAERVAEQHGAQHASEDGELHAAVLLSDASTTDARGSSPGAQSADGASPLSQKSTTSDELAALSRRRGRSLRRSPPAGPYSSIFSMVQPWPTASDVSMRSSPTRQALRVNLDVMRVASDGEGPLLVRLPELRRAATKLDKREAQLLEQRSRVLMVRSRAPQRAVVRALKGIAVPFAARVLLARAHSLTSRRRAPPFSSRPDSLPRRAAQLGSEMDKELSQATAAARALAAEKQALAARKREMEERARAQLSQYADGFRSPVKRAQTLSPARRAAVGAAPDDHQRDAHELPKLSCTHAARGRPSLPASAAASSPPWARALPSMSVAASPPRARPQGQQAGREAGSPQKLPVLMGPVKGR